MTASAARFGEDPTMAERLLVAARDVDDQVDGQVPRPLPSPPWFPIKTAAALVGYSEPGLRKAIKRHVSGAKWWRYVGARLLIDTGHFGFDAITWFS
jgi:hypothetical protein